MTAHDLPPTLPDTFDLRAAAEAVIAAYADPDLSATARAAAGRVWQALTGAPDVVAGIAYAALARDSEGPLNAVVAPF